MVSSPSAYRASPSGEKTGLASRSASGSRQSPQSVLSAAASPAIVSQTSASKACHRGDRSLDLLLAVGRGGKERLELGGREVDALLERVPEESAVPLRVGRPRVLEIADGAVRHEQCEESAHTLHVAVRREAFSEQRGATLEPLIDVAAPRDRPPSRAGCRRACRPGRRARPARAVP